MLRPFGAWIGGVWDRTQAYARKARSAWAKDWYLACGQLLNELIYKPIMELIIM